MSESSPKPSIPTSSSIETSNNDSLVRELEQLQSINTTVSNLIKMIQSTSANLNTISRSSGTTELLLDQWIRILNQTNFTHDVINDPNWVPEENDESQDLQQKLLLEQNLLVQLNTLESENAKLQSQIDRDTKIHDQKSQRDASRKRELGLLRSRAVDKKPRIVK